MLSEARRASEGRDGAPDRASGAGAGDGDCEPSRMCIAPGDEGREEDVGYDVLMAASRASALMRGLLVRGLPMCDWKRADESRYGESVPGRWCASIGRGDPCGEPGGIPPSPEENLDIECGCAPLGAPAGGGRMGGSRLIVRSMRSVHNASKQEIQVSRHSERLRHALHGSVNQGSWPQRRWEKGFCSAQAVRPANISADPPTGRVTCSRARVANTRVLD